MKETILEKLQREIRDANHAYWDLNKPQISDKEYDKLIEKLRKLNPTDPLLTQIADAPVTGEKVMHKERMYSLGKVYDSKMLLSWMQSVARNEFERFDFEPKMDGISLELVDGHLITRGTDGIAGNDISYILPYIGVRMDLRSGLEVGAMSIVKDGYWGKKRIVGELLIFNKRFKQLKEIKEDGENYKSPRNMAAALTTLKPDQIRALWERAGRIHLATLVWHDAYSITRPYRELDEKTVMSLVDKMRGAKDMPCDGAVIKLSDREYAKSLGYTAHHPKGFIAYKFSEEEAEVVVKNIVWQTGENHVTPVCEFDPVVLDDASINRVTAHSKDFFVENNICVGSTLTIIRQGGVIPKIIGVTTPKGMTCVLPTVCPDCGQPLKEEGAFLSCTNDECSSRIACRIVRGLNILGLKGVGPALALKVIGEMYIPDIMAWAQEISELKASPELWNEKWLKRQTKFTASELATLMKLPELMERGVTASDLLKSVCIPEVGDMFVKAINKYAGGVEKLMKVVPVDGMYDYLVDHPGVNLDALTNFMIWMERHHEEFVMYLGLFKILPESTMDDGIGSAEGVVCFTGTGPKPRKELEATAREMGFVPTENVNLAGVLVCADPNGNSSKLKKAREKGKLIMSYEEFFKNK